MASPWFTYSPHHTSPPPRDVQPSDLADNSHHTVPSELIVSDVNLVSTELAKRQALGWTGRSPSVSSIPPFNSANTEGTSKVAPILVSATSFGFEFRETGPLSTRTSADEQQHASALPQSPRSSMSNDGERDAPTSEGAAAPIPPTGTHKQHVGPQSSLSSGTFERGVFASSPTQNTRAAEVTPISAAENATPPPPPDPATPSMTTGDVSTANSPTISGSRTPTITLSLVRSPEQERSKSERPVPRTAGSTGSGGSGSISVVQSRYTDMVFEEVPRAQNLLSGLFTWVLLAGFVVLPGTFSSLEQIQTSSGEVQKVLDSISSHHIPLLTIAFGCCGVGACGMLLLWWRWAHNYVWLLNSIFVPGMLNGLSGVVSTFSSVYGVQGGKYDASSIATLAATGACTIVCGFLTAIYSLWKLDRVKRHHQRGMEQVKSGGEILGEVQYF